MFNTRGQILSDLRDPHRYSTILHITKAFVDTQDKGFLVVNLILKSLI